jgi:DNA-binding NarL/FixJ family response regulator
MIERSILFIGAEESAAASLDEALRKHPVEPVDVVRVEALIDGLRALQEGPFDLIVSDLLFPAEPGSNVVTLLQQHAPHTPVIVLCHAGDRDAAVTAVRKGAFDFFCYEDLNPANLSRSVWGAMKHAQSSKLSAAERRNHARFPCRLAVSYQTLEQPIISGTGTSETLNVGSKGLLFTSNEQFHAGQLIQVSLEWPARLENQIPLKLVAEGRIIRNSNGQTAMTIEKYEFRTRRMRPPEPAQGSAIPPRKVNAPNPGR